MADLAALSEHVLSAHHGRGPVTPFGSSGGAVVALGPAQQRPDPVVTTPPVSRRGCGPCSTGQPPNRDGPPNNGEVLSASRSSNQATTPYTTPARKTRQDSDTST